MSKLIKIFLITLLALAIRCKSNEGPQATGETSSNHPSQGTYTIYTGGFNGSGATVTINNGGTCTITGTAYFDANDSQTFSITVTKWWYFYSNDKVYYAGSYNEQSEATINSPATDYFYVSYNTDSGELWIVFGPEGKRYYTGNLTKQ